MTDHVFRVRGLHCAACPALVDELIAQDPRVASVATARREARVRVALASPAEPQALLDAWNPVLEPHGYRLLPETASARVERGAEFWWGTGLGVVFLALFAALQLSGVATLFSPDTLEVPGSFLLGVLASLSSCFALVGGLLLGFTVALQQSRPQAVPAGLAAFHLSRLVTFVVLGGLLGQLGHLLALDAGVFSLLYAVAAVTLVVLGLNLLGLVPPLPALPWPRRARATNLGPVAGGLLLGASTFFLPCGFTQTVQFQALAAGSFVDGAALLLAFALGTLPVLLLVSFALRAGLSGKSRRLLLSASGVVVFGLGLYQLQGALVLLGWIRPLVTL